MVSGAGRTVTWSAFGMPVKIEQGLRAIEIAYGPDRARFKRIDRNETGTTTTHYVAGGAYEAVRSASGQVTHKTTVAGVAVIVDRQLTPGQWTTETRYLLADHLGSVDAVTDHTGAIVERVSFDASFLAHGDSRSESRPPCAHRGPAPPGRLASVHRHGELPVAGQHPDARLSC